MKQTRDIVVIGASAGGVDALLSLAAMLPEDFPAAIFVVLHVSPAQHSLLPDLLNHRGLLHARHALHGDKIVRGEILVAPPDNQLLLRRDHVDVVRGPKENGHRPAVDALFRTAAGAFGPRVVGVVLTGQRDCGTAGLLSVKAHGGVAVVQDPDEAFARDMPANAMAHVDVDHVVKLADLPALLERLVRERAPAEPKSGGAIDALDGAKLGEPADLVCPTCHGKLTEAEMNGFTQFRCHVGHVFSLSSVVEEQGDEVERALWEAIRALEEAAGLADRLANTAPNSLRAGFAERARTQRNQADVIRRLVLGGAQVKTADAAALASSASPRPARKKPRPK